MSDGPDQDTRSAAPLLRAARHAALHPPKEPPRTLLRSARSGRSRIALPTALAALGIGFAGGSIAIYTEVMHVARSPGWLLSLVQCLPLVVAARWPLVAWRIAALGMFTGVLMLMGKDEVWPWPVTSFLALVLMLFAVGVSYERRSWAGVGAVTVAGLLVPAIVIDGMNLWVGAGLAAVVGIVLVFGDAVGGRYSAELSLAEQAELRRQDLARQAVLEERARIARELHDVVAHHMSVIAMQSEAAPYKIPDLPDAAKETFSIVRDAAREALAETRRVVGLLRADDEAAERRPQPGLARIEELIAAARQAGLGVETRVVGMPRTVSAGVDLSAYRIVQESLSNASRYAPGAQVLVEIRYDRRALRVTVTDDGPRTTPQSSGGGHGLVGMRERVTMLGGSLSAGRRRPDATEGGAGAGAGATAARPAERPEERPGEHAAERAGDKSADRAGDRSFARAAGRSAERATGRAGERAAGSTTAAPGTGWIVVAELPYDDPL